MNPRDLFIEAAKLASPDREGDGSPANEREQEAIDSLRVRSSDVLDAVSDHFRAYASVTQSIDGEQYDEGFRIRKGAHLWSGGTHITVRSDGTPEGRLQLTRKWASLVTPAEPEFQVFAPDGYYVAKRLLIGVHDLMFAKDEANWDKTVKAASLEVITGLLVVPEDEDDWSKLDNGDVLDPFQHIPPFLERLNYLHPVFSDFKQGHDDYNDIYYSVFGDAPIPRHYPTDIALVEALQASLDDFDKALGNYR